MKHWVPLRVLRLKAVHHPQSLHLAAEWIVVALVVVHGGYGATTVEGVLILRQLKLLELGSLEHLDPTRGEGNDRGVLDLGAAAQGVDLVGDLAVVAKHQRPH